MITLPINTTRDLTPAELAAAQAFLDTINPPPGTITVVNTISHDAAFSGGTVTLNTPGAVPQEQFWRALNLPAVPLCATGPNVTLDFSADLTISNTISNPQGCIAVIDVTQVGVAALVAGDVSAPPGNGTWTLSLVATALDLTKFQNGDYVVVFCSAEALGNEIADFAWSNASASITYDDANCGPGGGVTVSPSSLEVPSGCVCEPITLTITNSTGAPLNGHLLSLSTPADWSTRAAVMTYSGGASGIANAPGASFVVSTWPDGGVVTLACELCPGCSDDGVYSVTVDVTSNAGALVASEPVSVGRGVPAPPIAPIAPRVAAPQAAPAKAAAKTTAKRKATK